jgi:DNA-binding Lrp family transcriptional regulator
MQKIERKKNLETVRTAAEEGIIRRFQGKMNFQKFIGSIEEF